MGAYAAFRCIAARRNRCPRSQQRVCGKNATANVKDGRPHELMQAVAAIVGIDLGTVAAGRRDIGCATELVEPGSAIKLDAG